VPVVAVARPPEQQGDTSTKDAQATTEKNTAGSNKTTEKDKKKKAEKKNLQKKRNKKEKEPFSFGTFVQANKFLVIVIAVGTILFMVVTCCLCSKPSGSKRRKHHVRKHHIPKHHHHIKHNQK
jgi:hypothetical protein